MADASAAELERARAAVTVAVQSLQSLRAEVVRVVPERSRGRREIVQTIDQALRETGLAIQGLGDDTPGMWRRALDTAQRAVERTARFIVDVHREAAEALARLWRTTVEVARAAKEAVAGAVRTAYEAAKTAVAAAATILTGLIAASGVVMFSGWVVLAFIVLLYFGMKD